MPTRVCRKMTGPFESSLIARLMPSKTGESIPSAVPDNTISTARLYLRYNLLFFCICRLCFFLIAVFFFIYNTASLDPAMLLQRNAPG